MTSGRGATIGWTSYNYPSSIANGLDTSSFSYTPDRQYWRQISNYTNGGAATTIYVGGLLEKVTTSAGTDYRHMIRAGGSTIIVSRQSSGTNSMYYVTSDHLGSSSAITNSSGGVLVNSSFDAFGKRRGANWSGSPSGGDWTANASTTRRGYTDHSMLDNLNLIHMSGRVQDPVMGLMASADPYVTEPGNTRSFNRYSYVNNAPLTYSDPTGFWTECGAPQAMYRSVTTDSSQETEDGSTYGNGSVTALVFNGFYTPCNSVNDSRTIVIAPPVMPKVTECQLVADTMFDEPSDGHHDRELRADAALVADLAGNLTSSLSEHFRDSLSYVRGRPPLSMTTPVPTGLGPMTPTVLSKYAFLSQLATYSETLHYAGRTVGVLGAGLDFINAGASYEHGDKLQSTLDGLSGSLGTLMAIAPETIPVALPTLGMVKGMKPYVRSTTLIGCMNGYENLVPAY